MHRIKPLILTPRLRITLAVRCLTLRIRVQYNVMQWVKALNAQNPIYNNSLLDVLTRREVATHCRNDPFSGGKHCAHCVMCRCSHLVFSSNSALHFSSSFLKTHFGPRIVLHCIELRSSVV